MKRDKSCLNGVRGKFKQAIRHSNLFDEKYKSWKKSMIDNPPMTIEKDPTPSRPTFVITAPPVDLELSLIVGDCVHNLRVSLDHLAGQLALRDGHSVKIRSALGFPIFTNKLDYEEKGLKKINPFIKDADVLGVIEAMQPYHSKDPKADLLWLLSELDNIDKHRTLIVIAPNLKKKAVQENAGSAEYAKQLSGAYSPYSIDFQIELSPPNDPTALEEGRAERTITIRSDASLFTDTGLACDKWPVQELLQDLSGRVQEILHEFEEQFFRAPL